MSQTKQRAQRSFNWLKVMNIFNYLKHVSIVDKSEVDCIKQFQWNNGSSRQA